MIIGSRAQRFSRCIDEYAILWERYISSEVDQTLDPADKENKFENEWQRNHYFEVGADAARLVVQALLTAGRPAPARLLDFPCGSGRVTRHFRALFPDTEIGGCDLYQNHVEFCSRHFATTPFQSTENFDDLDIGEWDVVFCGSLLTHLPAPLFWKAIRFIERSLSPDGIAVVTLEGRHVVHIQDHKWKLIDDDLFDIARGQYEKEGFGFVNYDAKFRQASFNAQETYGVALTRPDWLMNGMLQMPSVRILDFTERAWDDHQDVLVFGKPAINA